MWPSAETICHSTSYLPELPRAAFVVIDGPSTETQPSSWYLPSGPITRKAKPESEPPMASNRSFVVMSKRSGSSVSVPPTSGVEDTR